MVYHPDFWTSLSKARRAPPVSRSGLARQRRGGYVNGNPNSVLRYAKFELSRRQQEIPMRAVILILVIIVLAVIAAIATGFVNINQIRGAQAPSSLGHAATA